MELTLGYGILFGLLTEVGASALLWLRSVCYRVGMSERTQRSSL